MVRYKVLQPSLIRFTASTIQRRFENGTDINDIVQEVTSGRLNPSDIQAIRVFNLKGIYYTCDNKRLYVFRAAQFLGKLDYISVIVVSPCDVDLTVIKSGQEGSVIRLDDGSEPYEHWDNAWSFPNVITRQIPSSSSNQDLKNSNLKKPDKSWSSSSSQEDLLLNNPTLCNCIMCCKGGDESE